MLISQDWGRKNEEEGEKMDGKEEVVPVGSVMERNCATGGFKSGVPDDEALTAWAHLAHRDEEAYRHRYEFSLLHLHMSKGGMQLGAPFSSKLLPGLGCMKRIIKK